jgi:hypothetical protein
MKMNTNEFRWAVVLLLSLTLAFVTAIMAGVGFIDYVIYESLRALGGH